MKIIIYLKALLWSYLLFGLAVQNVNLFAQHPNIDLQKYSATYKAKRDYKSLKILTQKALFIGLIKEKVVEILGEPDYSPTEGLYYYSSDKKNTKGVTKGLVLDYRKYNTATGDSELTGRLQSISLMFIGE